MDKRAVTEALETRNTSVLYNLETGEIQRQTKVFPSCITENQWKVNIPENYYFASSGKHGIFKLCHRERVL